MVVVKILSVDRRKTEIMGAEIQTNFVRMSEEDFSSSSQARDWLKEMKEKGALPPDHEHFAVSMNRIDLEEE